FPAVAGPGAEMEAGYPYQAMEWQYRLRAHPAGKIPADWRETALSQMTAMKGSASARTLSALSWLPLGPDDVGGRIRSIAIDPTNTDIIYCGSVSGGVWKSTDAGANWLPTNDMAANLVIGAIAIDPNNSNIIYAGTGEGYFNIDALRGAGTLKSTDGGATWALTTTFSASPSGFPYYINDIYIRPDNSLLLFAATNSGLYRSTNAGTSWLYVTKTTGTRRATQIAADEFNPGTFYVAYGNFSTDGIYKTTDGGASFAKLAGGFPTNGFYRISMAISKGDPSVLYAVLTDSATYGTHSVQKTTDGGATWTAVTTPSGGLLGGTHLGNQGWYNNVAAVHPTDFNRVYVGGINTFRSTDGGSSWPQMTHGYPSGLPFMHVDQHAIAFDPNNPSIMYFGNDGGMYKSTDGGNSFTEINNGLAVTQFYSGAAHPSSEIYYGGTQDNGTLKTAAAPAWTESLSGDGGATAVDFVTPATVYTEYVYLNFQKSTNSGLSWLRSMTGIPTSGGLQSDGTSDRCAFIAPFTMDPTNPQVLVAGTYLVYRTTNGASGWTAISTDLTGDPGGANGVGDPQSVVSAIAIAKSAPATIYAGTTGYFNPVTMISTPSSVQVTTNTGSTWTNTTKSPLPDRAVTSIAIDPANASRAYIGFSGYNTNTPTTPGHLFRTTNRGTTWTNVSGNLPDVPVNAVALDTAHADTHIIVGTDLGVFETANGGTSWTEENSGMAKVAVFDLDLRNDGVLVAATHGRGMFKTTGSIITSVSEIPSGVPLAHRLAQNYPNPFNPVTTVTFDVASASDVTLRVYDAAGREVARLFDGPLDPGSYGSTFDGAGLASGVYFSVLETSSRDGGYFRDMKKMLLVR
ncbi:MAG TPA: T9SS type A sorting domain-containing protein, partial [Bacteroidota bacterium]|nr:T9SS type A sorting domain-containing protein [Bacteroidota bacterium]